MELALAPAPATWGRRGLRVFYASVAAMPVDIVYVGETVCSKRDPLSLGDLREIADVLRQAGKRVVVSTPGLVTAREDYDSLEQALPIGDGVEVNSLGALRRLSGRLQERELVIGSCLNVYNREAAEVFLSMGASRLVLPAELPYASVADIAEHTDALEVSVWGALSCADSWRCYTARSLGVQRADCDVRCMDYPNGMTLQNVDSEAVFVVDGPRIMTARDYCLVEQLGELAAAGVRTARIHPSGDTREVVSIFRQALDGRLPLDEATSLLRAHSAHGLSNGWFHGRPGIDFVPAGIKATPPQK